MKILYLEIEKCSECPYHNYDAHYSMSKDSGYDCDKMSPYKRIIDDYDLNRGKEMLVPEWCPLMDIDNFELFKQINK
jgi:hypothetical protein